MSLFKRKPAFVQEVPDVPVVYPSGVCVETESGRYYLKGNKRYVVKSESVFKSWNFPVVCKSSDVAISKYQKSLRPLGFRDGSVVRDIFNGELFIISGTKKVKITDTKMYDYLGLEDLKIPYVSHEEIGLHPDGDI